jgi:hypothetical protein
MGLSPALLAAGVPMLWGASGRRPPKSEPPVIRVRLSHPDRVGDGWQVTIKKEAQQTVARLVGKRTVDAKSERRRVRFDGRANVRSVDERGQPTGVDYRDITVKIVDGKGARSVKLEEAFVTRAAAPGRSVLMATDARDQLGTELEELIGIRPGSLSNDQLWGTDREVRPGERWPANFALLAALFSNWRFDNERASAEGRLVAVDSRLGRRRAHFTATFTAPLTALPGRPETSATGSFRLALALRITLDDPVQVLEEESQLDYTVEYRADAGHRERLVSKSVVSTTYDRS